MQTKLKNYIKAAYSGLYILSAEECRVECEMKAVADSLGYGLYVWSLTTGICAVNNGQEHVGNTNDPLPALEHFKSLPEKSILLLRDFHMLLAQPDPMLFRAVKDALRDGMSQQRHLVIMGCSLHLPAELEKEFTVVRFDLPGRDALREIMHRISSDAGKKVCKDIEESLVDAACGLTTNEASNAFALSIIERGEVTAHVVNREKCAAIAQGGILEVVNTNLTLADVGGLEILTRDLTEKKGLFSAAAAEYGLDNPRGCLIVGQPGTGKSLVSKITANIFGLPLLRLDLGNLFGSLVGQTEANWRAAHSTAKAIAPCIVWIDDCDFSGAKSSGQTDSGTTSRLFKSILVDMQENSKGIFYVLTANDIDTMPDPLIRRLDVYAVDLPTQSEREAILEIHIAKRNRKLKDYDINNLAAQLAGYSGSEIEQVWLKAMNLAFVKHREPKVADVVEAISRIKPTSVTMKDSIEARRQRLAGRATNASAPEIKSLTSRKLAA